jgi:iron complex outermembrane receptor protein
MPSKSAMTVEIRPRRERGGSREYGGADVRDLGPAVIGVRSDVAKPTLSFGPLTRDEVRQVTGGIGYELRWPGVAEASLGIQKTGYRRNIRVPGLPTLEVKDSPWLYNGTLALHASRGLLVYGGYTRGLEESGAAPANALNRNSATTALLTN